jgi:hypothetical protein
MIPLNKSASLCQRSLYETDLMRTFNLYSALSLKLRSIRQSHHLNRGAPRGINRAGDAIAKDFAFHVHILHRGLLLYSELIRGKTPFPSRDGPVFFGDTGALSVWDNGFILWSEH